ncbi:hypothetical protein Mmc1_0186 [Magnetococcus marinus MC-1]|uniref:Uncharacterized protein n=1 Tax=Magnetococcus marinus (strain ATCC BAA-1437 / JCM 17883 / MC-1) TaxID=156889 RepID=A0L420_MAGMM|nr:hypothetical protein [Magnetococcus marinus]ABK42713.1 hypothetical protein Mmc1_0186 [Magnetococcus marinus MC-1]
MNQGWASERMLLQEGISDHLLGLLSMVAETEQDGDIKFPPQTCHELQRMLVCRTYAQSMIELCYLLRAGHACGDHVTLFWEVGAARSQRFRHYFNERLPAQQVTAESSGVVIADQQDRFTVHYSRMPLLAALWEFLFSALDYAQLDESITTMLMHHGDSRQATSQCANQLARLLYAFLKDHLPEAQQQRKFRRITQFIQNYTNNHTFAPDALDNSAILQFWQQFSLGHDEDGGDFKKFETVYHDFLNYRRALRAAIHQQALMHTHVLGTDRDAGEWEPDSEQSAALWETLRELDEEASPLHHLNTPPCDEIKFFNNREQNLLKRIVEGNRDANDLALSLLRCELFGHTQACIVQALRQKVEGADLLKTIAEINTPSYRQHQQSMQDIAHHLTRVQYASLHLLLYHQEAESIRLILNLYPDLDLSKGREHHTESVGDEGSMDGVAQLRSILEQQGVWQSVQREAARAYKGIARQGFRDNEMDSPTICAGHAQAAPLLEQMDKLLSRFLTTLHHLFPDENEADTLFAADRAAFTRQFRRMYGGES